MSKLEIDAVVNNKTEEGLRSVEQTVKAAQARIAANSRSFTDLFSGIEGTDQMKRDIKELGAYADQTFMTLSEGAQAANIAIQESQISIKYLDEMMGSLNKQYHEGTLEQEQYEGAMARLVVMRQEAAKGLAEQERALSRIEIMERAESGSIEDLRAKLTLLTVDYQKLDEAQRKGTEGENILKQMKETSIALSDATKEMSTYGEETIDTYSRIDGLVTRLGASLPSLMGSPMALVSQMPSLIQNLSKAQEEYDKMSQSGKDAEPVWKQLIGAALNWKTALIALVPIIYANREAIGEWIITITTGHKPLADFGRAMDKVTKSLEENTSAVAKDISQINKLAKEWKSLASNDERLGWIETHKSAFESLGTSINDATQAEALFSDPTKLEAFKSAMMAKAKAAAAAALAQKKYEESIAKGLSADAEGKKASTFEDIYASSGDSESAAGAALWGAIFRRREKNRRDDAVQIKEEIETIAQIEEEANAEFEELLKKAGLKTKDKHAMQVAFAAEYNQSKSYRERLAKMNEAYLKAEANQIASLVNAVTNAELEAREEGNQKTLAQMEAQRVQQHEALEKQRRDYVESMVNMLEAEFNAREQEKQRHDPTYKLQSFDREAARASIDTTMFSNADAAQQRAYFARVRKFYADIQKEYESLAQGVQRINKKYDDDLAAMYDPSGNLRQGFSQENVDQLEKDRADALVGLYEDRSEEFQRFAANIGKLSLKQLKDELARYKYIVENMDQNNPAYSEMLARYRSLEERVKSMDKTTDNSKVNWTELSGVLRDAVGVFNELGDAIGGTTGDMIKMGGQFASSALQIANGVNVIKTAETSLEKASGLLAAISAVLSVINTVVNIAKEHEASALAMAKANNELAASFRALADAKALDGANTIFGTDAAAQMKENVKIAEDAKNQFSKIVSDWSGVLMGADYSSGWDKFIGQTKGSYIDLGSSFMDGNGAFDGDALRAWYEANKEAITDEGTKQVIDNVLTEWDRYKDAVAAVGDYVKDVFSGVADDITDKMVTAFLETGDAVADLTDITQNYTQTLAKSMVKSMILSELTKDGFQDTVTELITSRRTEEAVQLVNDRVEGINALAPEITKLLQAFGVASSASDSATAKGIAQASQDSVDELNGRMTAIQTHTFTMNENVKQLLGNSNRVLSALTQIIANTSHLEAMKDSLASISRDMNDMLVKGVDLRYKSR